MTGLTSQGFPSYFRISPNGKTVDDGRIALQLDCTSGAVLTFPDSVPHIGINAAGRTHFAVTVPLTGFTGGSYRRDRRDERQGQLQAEPA